DPSVLSNGRKKERVTEDPSSEQDNSKPKATRHILLIRHSQYNLSGNGDTERFLTPLGLNCILTVSFNTASVYFPAQIFFCFCLFSGREQAELTGQRLAVLGLKYDVLIHSSMTRATETAHIISKHIPGS
ncbi:hypothetical protein XENOCAPTIV_013577, partial [Xenoophorus captivus]